MYSDEENEEEAVKFDPKVKKFLSEFSIPRRPEGPTSTQEKLLALSGTTGNGSSVGYEPASPAKKRTRYDQSTWTTSWSSNYDKPIPQSILEKCTVEACNICELLFTSIDMGKQHYEGQKHSKKVNKVLQELCPEGEVPCKKAKIEVDVDKSVTDFLSRMGNEVERTDQSTWGSQKLSEIQEGIAKSWDRPLPPQLIGLCHTTKCDICEATFTSGPMAQSHFTGKKHEKKFTDFLKVFCEKNNVDMPVKKNTNYMPDSKGSKGSGSSSEEMCNLCDVKLTSPAMADLHYKGKQHRKRELSGVPKADTKEDPSGRFGIGKDFSKKEEKEKVKNGNSAVNSDKLFYCSICDVETTSEVTLEAHKAGNKHIKKAGGQPAPTGGQKEKNPAVSYKSCDVCGVDCPGESQWQAHLSSKKHINRAENGVGKPQNAPPPPSGAFRCDVCDISTMDQAMLDSHLTGKKHAAKLKGSA